MHGGSILIYCLDNKISSVMILILVIFFFLVLVLAIILFFAFGLCCFVLIFAKLIHIGFCPCNNYTICPCKHTITVSNIN